jgi:hypothetical protein
VEKLINKIIMKKTYCILLIAIIHSAAFLSASDISTSDSATKYYVPQKHFYWKYSWTDSLREFTVEINADNVFTDSIGIIPGTNLQVNYITHYKLESLKNSCPNKRQVKSYIDTSCINTSQYDIDSQYISIKTYRGCVLGLSLYYRDMVDGLDDKTLIYIFIQGTEIQVGKIIFSFKYYENDVHLEPKTTFNEFFSQFHKIKEVELKKDYDKIVKFMNTY